MPFLPFDAPPSAGRQLVVTLAPASLPNVRELAAAGATGFRLNASHLTPQELEAALVHLRAQLPEAPVIVDLQGAKMRVGGVTERSIQPGDRLRFSCRAAEGAIVAPHAELYAGVRPGETLSCDDGRLRFRVESVAPESLEAIALDAGTLRPNKGINCADHPIYLEHLPQRDRAMAEIAKASVGYAISFMRDGREADWIRGLLGPTTVVGKIETREATAALDTIAGRVSAIWICRGDLGEQLGPAPLARFVARLDPRSVAPPVLMAGQVLQGLVQSSEPSRAELCHLYDLLLRGYSGIVLSDETAVGAHPVRATQRAAELLDLLNP